MTKPAVSAIFICDHLYIMTPAVLPQKAVLAGIRLKQENRNAVIALTQIRISGQIGIAEHRPLRDGIEDRKVFSPDVIAYFALSHLGVKKRRQRIFYLAAFSAGAVPVNQLDAGPASEPCRFDFLFNTMLSLADCGKPSFNITYLHT